MTGVAAAGRLESRWRGIGTWCLLAFVVLLPVQLRLGPAGFPAEPADIAALGFLACWLASGAWKVSARLPVAGAALLYLGFLLPSLWNSTHPGAFALGWVKSAYGVLLGLAIAGWVRRPAEGRRLAAWAAGTAVVMAASTLLLWILARFWGRAPEGLVVTMLVPNVGEVVRVKGLFMTPTMLANYLTIGVPLLAGAAAVRWLRPGAGRGWPKRRLAVWAVLAVGLLAAGATASHSLAGALAAAALVAPGGRGGERWARRFLGLAAVLAVAFSLFSTTVHVHHVQREMRPLRQAAQPLPRHVVPGGGAGEELTLRLGYAWVSYGVLKRLAWEAWTEHPWVGLGLGEFTHRVGRAFAAGRIHYDSADPHSTWLGALAETGLLGLLGLIGLWAAVLCTPGRRSRSWPAQAARAGLIGLLINGLHVDIMHFRFLWMAAGLLLASAPTAPEASSHG